MGVAQLSDGKQKSWTSLPIISTGWRTRRLSGSGFHLMDQPGEWGQLLRESF